MILFKGKDGTIIPYSNYDFIMKNYLILHGTEQSNSYVVEADNLEQKIADGGYFENKFPLLYDASYDDSKEEFIQHNGIPVKVEFLDEVYGKPY